MNVFEKDIEEIIEHLANGDQQASDVLKLVPTPPQLRLLAIDLDDMQMSGRQIVEAFIYSATDINQLIDNCAERDEDMVLFVNHYVTDRKARQGAPQTTAPQVDQAVKSILTDAENTKNLKRLDEEAEAVNRFFMTMMIEMQKRKDFTGTLRVNTGGLIQNASYAQFSISLVGLVDMQGKLLSVAEQPSAENARINEELSKTATQEGAKSFLSGLGEKEELADNEPQDALTRISYILAAHEATIKKIVHPSFNDEFSDWRWSFAVTLKEMREFVDGMLSSGTDIEPEKISALKEGRSFLRLNSVRIVPELADNVPPQQLNG